MMFYGGFLYIFISPGINILLFLAGKIHSWKTWTWKWLIHSLAPCPGWGVPLSQPACFSMNRCDHTCTLKLSFRLSETKHMKTPDGVQNKHKSHEMKEIIHFREELSSRSRLSMYAAPPGRSWIISQAIHKTVSLGMQPFFWHMLWTSEHQDSDHTIPFMSYISCLHILHLNGTLSLAY